MKKSTWIILGVAVVLAIIYFFTKQNKISVGIKRLELPTFEAAKIDAIDVIGKDKIHLEKVGEVWKLKLGEGDQAHLVDANQAHVRELLTAAGKIESAFYVTEDPEKQAELNVSGEKATTVTLEADKKPVWSLILGKSNADSSRYARLPDNNNIYAVRGSFYSITRNGLNDWREKNFWQTSEPDVVSLSVDRPSKSSFTLLKDEQGNWKISEATPALASSFRPDTVALASFVRSILNQRAAGYVDQKKELAAPLVIIEAKTKEGKAEVLEVFAGDDNYYWAKKKDGEQIYELNKSNFDRINKPVQELRDLSLMNFDKDAIVKVKLAAKDGAVIVQKNNGAWELLEPKKLPSKFEFAPERTEELLNTLVQLRGDRLADLNNDKPLNPNWQKAWLIELTDDKGNIIHFYAGALKANALEFL
ncbi:MAG TPA: DUF4340 domain-containing protein, partial [Myxococcota bacterium]|nr:DUF4340 domain-containing protein [Myxococcota bacterium]